MSDFLRDALIGGAAGVGAAGYEGARMQQKFDFEAEHERLRAERRERDLALQSRAATDLATHQSGLRMQEERAKPRTIAPGSTERRLGEPDFTAPVGNPQEQLDYYKASANRLNAQADAIRRGGKEKHELPRTIVKTDETGNPLYLIDVLSGAIGTINPATQAAPGESHWFRPDEPGTPARPADITWQYNGRNLPNGLADLYPSLSKRSPGESGAPGADPLGIRDPFKTSGGRPPLSNFFGSQAAPQAPFERGFDNGRPLAAPETPESRSDAEAPGGRALDEARRRVADAKDQFQRWGQLQRRRDPVGWEAAQNELEAAKRAERDALEAYQFGQGFNRAMPLGLLRAK